MSNHPASLRVHLTTALAIICGSALLSFGIYNIYEQNSIAEGGILGFTLLLKHVWNISPAISGFAINFCAYAIGFQSLGKPFIAKSLCCTFLFSTFYSIFEHFPPLLPDLSNHLFFVALMGGACIGIGCGLIIRVGGASAGDEVLAMVISRYTHKDIGLVFFSIDLVVLSLSICYLSLFQLAASLISVFTTSIIISLIVGVPLSPYRPKYSKHPIIIIFSHTKKRRYH